MITCQNCKTENEETALFCVKCGKSFINFNFTSSGSPLDLSPLYEAIKEALNKATHPQKRGTYDKRKISSR